MYTNSVKYFEYNVRFFFAWKVQTYSILGKLVMIKQPVKVSRVSSAPTCCTNSPFLQTVIGRKKGRLCKSSASLYSSIINVRSITNTCMQWNLLEFKLSLIIQKFVLEKTVRVFTLLCIRDLLSSGQKFIYKQSLHLESDCRTNNVEAICKSRWISQKNNWTVLVGVAWLGLDMIDTNDLL